jgi:hypothetical protein
MLKRSTISKEEIVADIIYFFVSALVSFIAIFVFDIHWNFYPGGTSFPPEKHIFQTYDPYYYGVLGGAIVGFFILKLVAFAFIENEIAVGILKKKKRK